MRRGDNKIVPEVVVFDLGTLDRNVLEAFSNWRYNLALSGDQLVESDGSLVKHQIFTNLERGLRNLQAQDPEGDFTVGKLLGLTRGDVLRTKRMGKKGLHYLELFLDSIGLGLDTPEKQAFRTQSLIEAMNQWWENYEFTANLSGWQTCTYASRAFARAVMLKALDEETTIGETTILDVLVQGLLDMTEKDVRATEGIGNRLMEILEAFLGYHKAILKGGWPVVGS